MTTQTPLFILHTDGAAKGNPGPSGIGIVLYKGSDATEPIAAFGEYIGETTNNVAEYKGLIRGLQEALERGADRIEARTDSELMARQIAGRYKVNAPQIVPLHAEACRLLSRFEKAVVVHVLRGKNALADKLANQGVAAGKPARPAQATPKATGGTLSVGVKKLPLSYFADLMDTNCWFDGETPTLRAVADHARRIYEADLSQPVVLGADGKLIDGTHRLAHAYLTGQQEIDVVSFEPDSEPDKTK